ncbi:S8 family serine peptidase [Methylophaga sp. OBS4]|uniref:S8 family serine peptidase n=1 Tax=Methylophaga sp. OBS4 TaxID=2991935 RepID=UPI0022505ABE|nr:S8 family serine peptidase [Methylophaga sp. OBS4]MCX4187489.1 S8 family serine peptidase [Methylophaga sp. OBS4]
MIRSAALIGLFILSLGQAETREQNTGASEAREPTFRQTTPPRTAPGVQPAPTQLEQQQFFTLVDNGCLFAGQTFTVKSRQKTLLFNSQWYLQSEATFIPLQQHTPVPDKVMLTMPDKRYLHQLQAYPLFFRATPSSPLTKTGLQIHSCSTIEQANSQTPYRAGEVLILVDETNSDAVISALNQLGLQIISQQRLASLSLSLITSQGPEQALERIIETLRQQFPDAAIDRNDYYHRAGGARLYAKKQMNWPHLNKCPAHFFDKLKVGLIDGPVAAEHPSLVDTNIQRQSFVSQLPATDASHASALAVILLGNNNHPALEGLIRGASIYAAGVIEQSEYGPVATTAAIVQALDWLISQQVRLVNISLSGSRANRVLEHTVRLSLQQGMLLFAATGNEYLTNKPAYPAAINGVFAITAIDAAGKVYDAANQGDYVDFSAPGVDVWTADLETSGQYHSGTSYAAPYALAVAAFYVNRNPSIARPLLYATLRQISDDLGATGRDPVFGWGLPKLQLDTCR